MNKVNFVWSVGCGLDNKWIVILYIGIKCVGYDVGVIGYFVVILCIVDDDLCVIVGFYGLNDCVEFL